MTTTEEEYKKAKAITNAYENEQERIYKLRVKAFEIDLKKYFKYNLIDGVIKLTEFELEGDYIIPTNPCLDDGSSGGNNNDIERLCKKHLVDFKIAYWCYHK